MIDDNERNSLLHEIVRDTQPVWDRVAARKAFQAADDAWGVLLRGVFGRHAGDPRYSLAGHGEPGTALRAAYNAREAARLAWEKARET